jgi:hypothetical protein
MRGHVKQGFYQRHDRQANNSNMGQSRPADDDEKGAVLVYVVRYLQSCMKNGSLMVNKFAFLFVSVG